MDVKEANIMEFFSSVKKINYEGSKSNNPLSFKFYNPDEVVMGKTMREHLRFSMAYWHTFTYLGADQFGGPSKTHHWDCSSLMDNAKSRVYAAFEFMEKMQIPYFCFHDADISPDVQCFW